MICFSFSLNFIKSSAKLSSCLCIRGNLEIGECVAWLENQYFHGNNSLRSRSCIPVAQPIRTSAIQPESSFGSTERLSPRAEIHDTDRKAADERPSLEFSTFDWKNGDISPKSRPELFLSKISKDPNYSGFEMRLACPGVPW